MDTDALKQFSFYGNAGGAEMLLLECYMLHK